MNMDFKKLIKIGGVNSVQLMLIFEIGFLMLIEDAGFIRN